MSHPVGLDGYSPAVLALGAQPRLPIVSYSQQPQISYNRTDIVITAEGEYEAIIAALPIKRAINTGSLNEAISNAIPGDIVPVYKK